MLFIIYFYRLTMATGTNPIYFGTPPRFTTSPTNQAINSSPTPPTDSTTLPTLTPASMTLETIKCLSADILLKIVSFLCLLTFLGILIFNASKHGPTLQINLLIKQYKPVQMTYFPNETFPDSTENFSMTF